MADDPVLEEYKICSAMIQHLDEVNWSWGAFLFGGTLAATGFVLSQKATFSHLAALSMISSIVLIGWLAYVKRMADMMDIYGDRMQAIEAYNDEGRIQIARLRKQGLVWRHNTFRKIFPVRGFKILVSMVILYLAALWSGAVILLLHIHLP